ncbi:MAG: hypothetical protein HQL17_02600 [Candidatus Omnitrophica bacterium]|nr:hypothetical protein [Candidatus Omnitrophota bacterium]
MEDGVKKGATPHKVSCRNTHASSVWWMGGGVVLVATVLCVIMFSSSDRAMPLQGMPVQGSTVLQGGGQQAAFIPPNCATCPTAPQCFPGATPAQQVAYTPGCAQQVGYTPGCAQPVAFAVPNRSVGAQPLSAGQNTGRLQCPHCNYVYSDPNALARGASQCPRCQNIIQMAAPGNGFTTVALPQPIKGAPPIFRDALMPHKFRGVCERCHQVNPDIAIPATTTQAPHTYRGVCSNCHMILGLQGGVK